MYWTAGCYLPPLRLRFPLGNVCDELESRDKFLIVFSQKSRAEISQKTKYLFFTEKWIRNWVKRSRRLLFEKEFDFSDTSSVKRRTSPCTRHHCLDIHERMKRSACAPLPSRAETRSAGLLAQQSSTLLPAVPPICLPFFKWSILQENIDT